MPQIIVTWYFHLLASFPEEQQKAYLEIQEKIGALLINGFRLRFAARYWHGR